MTVLAALVAAFIIYVLDVASGLAFAWWQQARADVERRREWRGL